MQLCFFFLSSEYMKDSASLPLVYFVLPLRSDLSVFFLTQVVICSFCGAPENICHCLSVAVKPLKQNQWFHCDYARGFPKQHGL